MALLSVYRKIRMHTTSQRASRIKPTAFAALSQRDRKALRLLSGRMFYYRSPIIFPQGQGKTLHPKCRSSFLIQGSLFPFEQERTVKYTFSQQRQLCDSERKIFCFPRVEEGSLSADNTGYVGSLHENSFRATIVGQPSSAQRSGFC